MIEPPGTESYEVAESLVAAGVAVAIVLLCVGCQAPCPRH
jgi:hypothetical protein